MEVPLSRPDISWEDKQAVVAVLDTPFLALGPHVQRFEEAVAGYVGARFGVAVSSGTSALHLLVKAFGIGEGDEVITTPFSFIASANCILYERARPVFVDVEPETGNINPDLIERAITARTKAILSVDSFGHPARLDDIRGIAERHGLAVIEDACESLGSEYRGQKCGSPAYAHGASFAFYPNKQITTGEGGMIVTDDEEVARLCRSMRNQGRGETGVWLSHERLGYNYRMDEMSAALGLSQFRRLEEILAKRERVARMYADHLSRISGISLPRVAPEVTRMSWFVYVIRVEDGINRDSVMDYLTQMGIQCRPYFSPIHLQPFYRQLFGYKEGDFPVAERLGRSCIAIPFHNNLTKEEIAYVAEKLEEAVARQQG